MSAPATMGMNRTVISPSMSLGEMYHFVATGYWEEYWDPRSRDIPFMRGGPWPIIAAMAFYVLFSAKLGPWMMRNRKPFELRTAMLVYNFTTVALNAYFFVCSAYYLNFGLELFNFKFPDHQNLTEVDFIKARLVFFYIGTKLYDLMDTIFFVLRKKNNQISGKCSEGREGNGNEHRVAILYISRVYFPRTTGIMIYCCTMLGNS